MADVAHDRADRAFDVVLAGPVFFDLVLSDLDRAPAPGIEVHAEGMATSPGGIANLAVATARLGLSTSLSSSLGDDVYGRWCRAFLRHEGVDLARTPMIEGWPTPVTVSIAHDGDRAMVTREEPSAPADPLAGGATGRAALADLATMAGGEETWWRRAAKDGTKIFADIGWDPTGAWDRDRLRPLEACFAFTRTDSPLAAARALAGLVPLAVVTCGSDGAVAVDAGTGEEATVPALTTTARDTTGAGDVFCAALVAGVLEQLPLADSLALAALCAGLAVTVPGGAVSSPGLGDLADWWASARDGDAAVAARYAFLGELPAIAGGQGSADAVRRAERGLLFESFRG
jgi:sugar/nucleoside kinase (ribokinase family)